MGFGGAEVWTEHEALVRLRQDDYDEAGVTPQATSGRWNRPSPRRSLLRFRLAGDAEETGRGRQYVGG